MLEREDERNRDATGSKASFAAAAAAIEEAATRPSPFPCWGWSLTDLLSGRWMLGEKGCCHPRTISDCANAAMHATCDAIACSSCLVVIRGPCEYHDHAEWPEITNFNY